MRVEIIGLVILHILDNNERKGFLVPNMQLYPGYLSILLLMKTISEEILVAGRKGEFSEGGFL